MGAVEGSLVIKHRWPEDDQCGEVEDVDDAAEWSGTRVQVPTLVEVGVSGGRAEPFDRGEEAGDVGDLDSACARDCGEVARPGQARMSWCRGVDCAAGGVGVGTDVGFKVVGEAVAVIVVVRGSRGWRR